MSVKCNVFSEQVDQTLKETSEIKGDLTDTQRNVRGTERI